AIIVVDNGSTDDTAAAVARHQQAGLARILLLRELAPGKSRAVARALTAADGDILAFTDDDVNVSAGWLDAVREAMSDPSVALAGGPVTPRCQTTVPSWLRAAR